MYYRAIGTRDWTEWARLGAGDRTAILTLQNIVPGSYEVILLTDVDIARRIRSHKNP